MATQDNSVPGSGYGNPYIDSLIWGCAWTGGPITYYFGSGPIVDDPSQSGSAWSAETKGFYRQALQRYENVCNVTFQEVGSYDEANVVWWQVPSSYILGFSAMHEVPDGTYNPMYGYFANDIPSFQGGNMYPGGYGFMIVCHEFGHMLGLAHPHDGGGEGDATTFPGVTMDATRDLGDHALNQGIWTTMSYNAGWNQIRSGTRAFGWQSGPMAFDIAALQILYGANMTYNTGNDTYVLPSGTQTFTAWSCIWDAGGIDTITAANLPGNCVINLNDAPLTGPNAGGYLSWMLGIPGGFTIANKAEIENAIGGNGNDRITGNELGNDLSGGLGKDTLDGGAGPDILNGGGGNDLYFVDDIGDQVAESDGSKAGGIDLVQSSASIKLGDNIENVILVGTGDANATGNGIANILVGNSGNNILDGGGGADRMSGGAGDDLYRIDSAKDMVIESIAGKAGGTDAIESGIALTLGANLENLTLTGDGDFAGKGNGLINEILGNEGSNYLLGFAGNDTLGGGGGNDTADGGAGADFLVGGDGDDLYVQDSALDVIIESGATLNDELRTNQMLSNVSTGIEHYSFLGGKAVNFKADAQDNRVSGTKLADTLTGDGGDDTLNGGAGGDSLSGGEGNDSYIVDNKFDRIADADGIDLVQSAINYELGADFENLTLIGMAVAGTGNGLGNEITGNALANKLDGSGGNDSMAGGKGNDVYYVDSGGDDVVENDDDGRGGIDTVVSMVDYTLGDFEENLTLDAMGPGKLAAGNELNNVLVGNGLDNRMEGGGGSDKMAGLGGNDTYVVDNAGDVVTETLKSDAGGTDTVESEVSFVLGANLENLTLLGDGKISGTGNAQDNIIIGNDGDNTLNGGAGADQMSGGKGSDLYFQDNANDKVSEAGGDGIDELRTNQTLAGALSGIEHYTFLGAAAVDFLADGAASRISGTKASDKIDGAGGDDSLTGNGGNDTLTGGIGNDSLNGGAGADSLIGADGNDTYVVDSSGDRIADSGGNDSVQSLVSFTLAAGLENLKLLGTAAIDGKGNDSGNVITGNNGANRLFGNGGADTLDGGVGNDVIVGSAGADDIGVSKGNDRIFYSDTLDGGDVIAGFDGNAAGGQDQINLDLLFDSIGVAAKDRAARVEIAPNGGDIEIRVDADGISGNGAELLVATLISPADLISVGTDVIVGT